jgi:hypothetical protein
VPPDAVIPPVTLARRTQAIAEALRAEQAAAESAADTAAETATLRRDLRRLAERLERLEDKVDLIRDGDDVPLAWPVAVADEGRLGVPPLDLSTSSSPAYDVLLGGSSRRDSA